ncbi:MAG: hypothetical protein ACJ8FO_07040 [Sphingomicrobium sp.]
MEKIERTRTRMEGLRASGRITLRDLQSVYEALFLRGVTSFEVFLESLFMAILRQKVRYPKSRVSLRMTAANDKALLEILQQNQAYLQWIPYSHTESRAKLYLNEGKPFSELTGGDKSIVKTITTIRNAIAHSGSHAKAEFERTVIGSRALLRGERTPAGFLRTAANPTQKRFEVYMVELSRIAAGLS